MATSSANQQRSPGAGASASLRALAAAVAGATDASDLADRLGHALGREEDEAAVLVRIWLIEDGESAKLLKQFPPRSERSPTEHEAIVAAVFSNGPLRTGSTWLAALRRNGTPFAVLEVCARWIDPGTLAELADIVEARLAAILDAGVDQLSSEALRLIDGGDDVQAVIAGFAAEAKRLLDHDRLSVYVLTADGCALERLAVATSPVLPGESDLIPLENYDLACVLDRREPLVTDDFVADERIPSRQGSIIAAGGFRGMISVPLRVSGTPIGLLNFVSRTAGFYDEADGLIAQQIANQVAIFFQNLSLERRVRESIQREAAQQERTRLARDLHDTLAQSLAEQLVHIDSLRRRVDSETGAEEDVAALWRSTHSMLEDLRRALLHLMPSELDRRSLGDAMTDLLAELQADHGIRTSIEVVGAPAGLAAETATAIFRIFQEAIANVRKHADASSVAVTLHLGDGVLLSVEDNGRGFASASQPDQLGIQNMRARADQIGGTLVVTSAENAGTTVTLRVPALQPPKQPPGPPRKPGACRLTRVLVVDDHPLFREAVARLLAQQDDIRVVGEVATATAAITETRRRKPDVVLLDVELPDASGISVVRGLVTLEHSPVVLMISAFPDSGHVVSAMKAGARGYVAKTIDTGALIEAIRTIRRGGTFFDAASGEGIWGPRELAQLSRRELDVLELVAAGKTNVEIAGELYLAKKTVERIVAAAAAKLRAKNRAHAVARAVSLKLVDVRDESSP